MRLLFAVLIIALAGNAYGKDPAKQPAGMQETYFSACEQNPAVVGKTGNALGAALDACMQQSGFKLRAECRTMTRQRSCYTRNPLWWFSY
ncbi:MULTISPECIES: hypothetical protein [unclassified Sinorhizobium]|uniref:hypothetical protein n=1 Tax=unclassified Sinorhizobium TaxID=2613772 RepID=UPI00352560C4